MSSLDKHQNDARRATKEVSQGATIYLFGTNGGRSGERDFLRILRDNRNEQERSAFTALAELSAKSSSNQGPVDIKKIDDNEKHKRTEGRIQSLGTEQTYNNSNFPVEGAEESGERTKNQPARDVPQSDRRQSWRRELRHRKKNALSGPRETEKEKRRKLVDAAQTKSYAASKTDRPSGRRTSKIKNAKA